jgi:uncharacterized protein YaaW (UPF0174 family)
VQQGTDTLSLCKLPAAHTLNSETVLQLLQAAVQQGSGINGFASLPATQELANEVVLQLLGIAVQQGEKACFDELCKLLR